MNKCERAKAIAGRMSATGTESLKFVDTFCAVVGESIAEEESVTIQNFGHFEPWKQNPRTGRNPRTGVICPIQERLSVKFKPGKGLLEKLNDEEEGRGV